MLSPVKVASYDLFSRMISQTCLILPCGRPEPSSPGWAVGEPVPPEFYAKHVAATNDRYTTGPEPGEPIPAFALSDQTGVSRSLANLTGPNGLLLVFHRSAEW